MSSKQVGVFLPISEIFPEIKNDFETFKALLREVSLTDALFWCAHLNLIISDPEADHIAKQEFALKQLLTSDEINRVNVFACEHGGAQRVMVFFRGQLLELVRWILLFCHNHPEDGTTFENPDVRRQFAQVALIASEIWANRIFADRFSLDGGVSTARIRALGSIRKSIEATSRAPYLPHSLGRGWLLFTRYISRYYQTFEDDFKASTQLSLEKYYSCVGAIIINFMNPKIGSGIFNVDESIAATPYGNVLQEYLRRESQTASELANAMWSHIPENHVETSECNYLPLREKPILRTEDGRAIILDPIFYGEKASIGPLFLLPRDKRDRAFTHFGKAFEDYVCDILNRMFPDISVASNKRLTCNIIGIDQEGHELEIDACLNDITDVILFEIKTGFIREDQILIDDFEKYVHHLRDKYVWNRKDDKGVGVGQLAKTIAVLASKTWQGNNQEFSDARRISPVLVVHDHLLGAPVYGHFFASEFKKLLAPEAELPSGVYRKGELQVAPLVVITIDDLENLETSIENFSFRNLLGDYTNAFPDCIESLHNFIASSTYKQHMRHNRNVAAAVLEIVDKIRCAFFPNVDDATL